VSFFAFGLKSLLTICDSNVAEKVVCLQTKISRNESKITLALKSQIANPNTIQLKANSNVQTDEMKTNETRYLKVTPVFSLTTRAVDWPKLNIPPGPPPPPGRPPIAPMPLMLRRKK
jgi:hypothetical protein